VAPGEGVESLVDSGEREAVTDDGDKYVG